MRTGITQDQVNLAADTILAAGENPTVEKVRAELGTGSPNTITRMLDIWRGQLGERLRQLSALPEVPEPVGQVMMELWRLAAAHAERTLEGRFASDRVAIEAARTQLARERESWEARLEAAETTAAQARAARDLAEHVCATLDGQLQDSHALRADLVQQRNRLQDQCDQNAVLTQALRDQLDEYQSALRAQLERYEAHIRAVEDRAHQEVDRARQDAKQLQQRLETSDRAHRDAIKMLEKRHNAVLAQMHHLDQQVALKTGQVTALEKALSEGRSVTAKRKNPSGPARAATKSVRGEKTTSRTRVTKQRLDKT